MSGFAIRMPTPEEIGKTYLPTNVHLSAENRFLMVHGYQLLAEQCGNPQDLSKIKLNQSLVFNRMIKKLRSTESLTPLDKLKENEQGNNKTVDIGPPSSLPTVPDDSFLHHLGAIELNPEVERQADVIMAIFFEKIQHYPSEERAYHRNVFADFLDWHRRVYFNSEEEIKASEPSKSIAIKIYPTSLAVPEQRDPSPHKSPRKSPPPRRGSSPVRGDSPPLTSRFSRAELSPRSILKNVGMHALTYCQDHWFHLLHNTPEDDAWKKVVTVADHESLSKGRVLNKFNFSLLIQTIIEKKLSSPPADPSFVHDVDRNLERLQVGEFQILKVIVSQSDQDKFLLQKNRFKLLLNFLCQYAKLESCMGIWDDYEKRSTQKEFPSFLERYLKKLDSKSPLPKFLAVFTQTIYIHPLTTVQRIIIGVPLDIEQESLRLKYIIQEGELQFHCSMFANLSQDTSRYPSDKFNCPPFTLECFNKMSFNEEEGWTSDLRFNIKIDKDSDKKMIEKLIVQPLTKAGVKVDLSFVVYTTNLVP